MVAKSDHKNATISHEMRFDRQKLGKNCDFELPCATLMQEMRFDRQTLWKGCDFDGPAATLCAKWSSILKNWSVKAFVLHLHILHFLHFFFASLTLFPLQCLSPCFRSVSTQMLECASSVFIFVPNILTFCLFHLSDDQLLHFQSLSLPFPLNTYNL